MNSFHDFCIKEINYISGAYVNDDLSMYPVNDKRALNVVMQGQNQEYPMIELQFEGLVFLRLYPVDELYTCEIVESCIFLKDNYIYWSDRKIEENDDRCCSEGTVVCASKLKWRPVTGSKCEKNR